MNGLDEIGVRRIDLNVDIGEGFPHDRELLKFASSANICCGVHAGSEEITVEAIALCKERGIRIGAHPGYPDRGSMGRNPMTTGSEREYLKSVFDQVEWFVSIAETSYLKPHGGFYNDTAVVLPSNWEWSMRKQPLASRYETGGVYLAQFAGLQSLLMIMRIHKLPLMGLYATAHRVVAERADQPLIREGFADRRYEENGTLVPRSRPDAVLTDLQAMKQQVIELSMTADSICLHGDTENCVEYAELVYSTLTDAGFEIGI